MMLFHPSAPSVERGKPQIISLSAVKPPVVCAADNLRFAFGLFKESRAFSIYPAARPVCPLPYRPPPPPFQPARGSAPRTRIGMRACYLAGRTMPVVHITLGSPRSLPCSTTAVCLQGDVLLLVRRENVREC